MAIIKKDAYFLSSTGENKIHCSIWQDDEKEPVGVFQIIHSIEEHIGRYEKFAQFLASEGYVVCGNDHLGHGLSADSFDDLGFFAENDGDMRLVDDVHILYMIMHKRYPELPYYMLGHSIGSMLLRVYATAFGHELSGMILCGCNELPSAAVVLEEPLSFLCKKLGAKANVPTSILDKIGNFAIDGGRTDKDWLSRDTESVDSYIDDPLCGNGLKLSAVRDVIRLSNSCCTDEWAFLVPPMLPILILSGAKDPMNFNGKGSTAVCDNLESAGHSPEVIMYPGYRHEILNEEDCERVYSDLLNWIQNI